MPRQVTRSFEAILLLLLPHVRIQLEEVGNDLGFGNVVREAIGGQYGAAVPN